MGDQTALFKQYENDYCNKSTDISRKINAIPSLLGEQRRAKTNEIENDLKSADIVIRSMDMEARQLPPTSSQPLLAKVKEYKADLSSLREQLKKAVVASPVGEAARAELGLGGDYQSSSAGQREKMLTATQRLEKSSDKLAGAKQTLAQTEEIGANILKDLHGQRETILRSRNTLQGADDNISKARKVLSSMARRVIQNKIIMFGVIAFLLGAIGIILYVKLR